MKKEPRTTAAEDAEVDTLLVEMIAAFRGLFDYLTAAAKQPPTDRNDHRSLMSELFIRYAGIGHRLLESLRVSVAAGYIAESMQMVRSLWEMAIDAAYVLSKPTADRKRLCVHYFAMEILRTSRRKEIYEGEYRATMEAISPEWVEAHDLAMREFGEHKALNPHQHWNGEEDKGAVRRQASEYFERHLLSAWPGVAESTKAIIFDLITLSSHVDPGANFLYPLDRYQRPIIGPDFSRPQRATLSAALAGIMVLAAVSERGGERARAEKDRLVRALDDILKRRGGPDVQV